MASFERLSCFLECGSGTVPRVGTVTRLIDILSKMGYNALYLGMTDAYKIKEEPYFNYNRGGYSTRELQEIDAFAKSKGVEVIPQINTLSHLAFLRKFPVYSDLFDTDSSLLVGDPRVKELAEHMIAAMAEGLSSRTIHIGMDEAFGLGAGEYRKRFGLSDRKELVLRHLSMVAEIAKKYGYQMEMWGDMLLDPNDGSALTAEEIRKRLPENLTLMAWEYETNTEEHFEKLIEKAKGLSPKVAYAGAIWKHLGFAPDLTYSLLALKSQMDAAKKEGVPHFVITLWGDNACPTPLWTALPGLYWASCYAKDEEVDKERFEKIVGVPYDALMRVERLNYPLGGEIKSRSTSAFWMFYDDPLYGLWSQFKTPDLPMHYRALEKEFADEAKRDAPLKEWFAFYAEFAKALRLKAPLNGELRAAYAKKDREALRGLKGRYEELAKTLEELSARFEKAFLKDNKGNGLEIDHYGFSGLLSRVQYAIRRIDAYLADETPIDELSDPILPLVYEPPVTMENSCMLDYRFLISFGLA